MDGEIIDNSTVVDSGEGSGALDNNEVNLTVNVAEATDSIAQDLFGKEPAKEPSEKVAPVVKTEEVKTPAEGEPKADEPKPSTVPKTWTKEAGATWETLPEVAKTEILRREEDMFRGLESYKAKASFGDSVQSILAPYTQIMTANNMEPISTIQSLLVAHHTLATGTPEQRTGLLHQLAKSYGVQLQPAGEESEPAYVDPKVAALEREVAQLRSGQAQQTQRQQQEVREKATQAVTAFATDPKNVYFDECADEIIQFINQGATLEQAYEKAVWLNPVTRAKEMSRIESEKQSKAGEDAARKAAEAKAAMAANVTTKPKIGGAAKPLGSMEDTMNDVLKSIKSR